MLTRNELIGTLGALSLVAITISAVTARDDTVKRTSSSPITIAIAAGKDLVLRGDDHFSERKDFKTALVCQRVYRTSFASFGLTCHRPSTTIAQATN